MSDIAIRVEGLGKRYRIGERERYKALRDVITDAAAAPFRKLRTAFQSNGHTNGNGNAPTSDVRPLTSDLFWALKDVNFEVKRGEVVGIIGRNGAGKSTLLKILSRITAPTTGEVEIKGRVGSLLEVGTGFHPELTGRENIYLNGAILGMRRAEINRKFDEMVAFAEIEKFIDTPVKRYSSGMYVRLAFAVAAHLDPEILLVDEVLAVGDRQFQNKCLGKINEVSHGGRTVLLVSHQMNQIRQLCEKVFWFDGGRIKQAGRGQSVVASYEVSSTQDFQERNGHCFRSWEVVGGGNRITNGLNKVTFRLRLKLSAAVLNGHLGMAIRNEENRVVAGWGFDDLNLLKGHNEILLELPSLPLRPSAYHILLSLFADGNNLTGGNEVDRWHATPHLAVEADELAHPQDEWLGLINVPASMVVNNR